MKKLYIIIIGLLVISGITFVTQPANSHKGEQFERKIVVYKNKINNQIRQDEIITKSGGLKIKHLDGINADVVSITNKDADNLKKDENILRIDNDVVVTTMKNKNIQSQRAPSQPSQTLPWGIDKIDADLSWGLTTGDPIKVAIIDTGIELTHPDLANNIKGGINTISPTKSANDDNGHGTHVAGIIAAENNAIGVIGVGPQIDLYAVKSLNRNGSGYLSDIIEGIDWAIANHIQVINMSLGATTDVQSFHDAIIRANAAGIVQVAAAGNDGLAVNYPAAYPEVIAVSATDSTDTITSWSSRGTEVDLAAPGLNIFSTYKGKTYKTLSGTSMSTPHVTGSAALVLTQTAKCDTDLNGACSPAEVQARLEATATDKGITGKDSLYGSGIVNIYNALTQ